MSSASGESQGGAAAEEDPRHDAVFLWSERQAELYQTLQIGPSACGATAIINVLRALGFECDQARVVDCVEVRLRQLAAPLPQYLASRSVAGCDQDDLIAGAHKATDGQVSGRFFPFWPSRFVNVSRWLAEWMSAGAVPVAVLNLQMGPHVNQVADAWHHQMIFGASRMPQPTVYLTNPLETVPVGLLRRWLASPSVLLIRVEDVLLRIGSSEDLSSDVFDRPRWKELFVREQIRAIVDDANLSRCSCQAARNTMCVVPDVGQNHELLPHVTLQKASKGCALCSGQTSVKERTCRKEDNSQCGVFTHIAIPAVYRSGIVLFAKQDNLRDRLEMAADLPVDKELAMQRGTERRW